MSRGAPTGFGGLLSHQNSVTQTGWVPGRVVPACSAPRSTLTSRPRSGVETSSGPGPDLSGPPPVLSIAWWAKTSNSAAPGQPCVLTRISVVLVFFAFFSFFWSFLTFAWFPLFFALLSAFFSFFTFTVSVTVSGCTQRNLSHHCTGRTRAPPGG